MSLSDSCSSDASTDSFHSRASTGRIYRTRSTTPCRRKQFPSKSKSIISDDVSDSSPEGLQSKKRCTWVTPNTDPSYANFHDEEWGIPVHDDKRFFELLVLCGALAELTWPSILSKRHIQIIDEFGSFDKYIWSFVNYKPIVGRFRYPRQVPVKTSKADVISKDLVRRGFRGVGPTVVYSFMQVAGITNDHLISCFRFQDCVAATEVKQKDLNEDNNTEVAKANEAVTVKKLSLSSFLSSQAHSPRSLRTRNSENP